MDSSSRENGRRGTGSHLPVAASGSARHSAAAEPAWWSQEAGASRRGELPGYKTQTRADGVHTQTETKSHRRQTVAPLPAETRALGHCSPDVCYSWNEKAKEMQPL